MFNGYFFLEVKIIKLDTNFVVLVFSPYCHPDVTLVNVFITSPYANNTILQHSHYTRKNAEVVTNVQQSCSNAVPTTCQQDVFALLVPSLLTSCQRLVDNLLQGCWFNRLVTSCSNKLLSSCNSTTWSTSCEWKSCSNVIKYQHCYNLLTSFLQGCWFNRLATSCSNNLLSASCNSTTW
jgi:hypothetical protein